MGLIIQETSLKPSIEHFATKKQIRGKDWKAGLNDAVMIPDRGFVKQLKCLDSELEVLWDWGSKKWEIWKFPKDGKSYHIMTVQTQDRSYRELGADVLLKMQENIFYSNNLSVDQICDYLDELDNQVRRRQKQDFMNQLQARVIDTFSWVRGVLQVQVPRKFRIERSLSDGRQG